MAATTREAVLAAIQARLPDNFARKIRAADVRDVLTSVANSTVFVNEDIFDQIIAARDAAVVGVDYVPVAGGAFTGAVQFPSGTAALPGVTFSGDTNTGMWRPAANVLAWSTNATERMRITSGGMLLLGGTSVAASLGFAPRFRLQGTAPAIILDRDNSTTPSDAIWELVQSASDGSFTIRTATRTGSSPSERASFRTNGDISFTPTGIFAVSTNGAERMRITSAGNVGIGTSSPLQQLSVGANLHLHSGASNTNSAARATIRSTNNLILNAAEGSDLYLNFDRGQSVIVHAGGPERMRVSAATGNVGIGTSAPSAAALLDVASTTSGFLPPRMTTTQRNAITSPPNGLMLYDTTTNKLQVRAGGAWVDLH
jgi:hypothetical protein